MKADTLLLLRTVAAWVLTTYGPVVRSRLRSIDLNLDGENVHLLIAADAPGTEDEFEPLPVQVEVLLALRDGDKKSDELAKLCKCDKNRLFEKGRGLDQLQEAGLVSHRERVGYYLTQEGERRAELIWGKRTKPLA